MQKDFNKNSPDLNFQRFVKEKTETTRYGRPYKEGKDGWWSLASPIAREYCKRLDDVGYSDTSFKGLIEEYGKKEKDPVNGAFVKAGVGYYADNIYLQSLIRDKNDYYTFLAESLLKNGWVDWCGGLLKKEDRNDAMFIKYEDGKGISRSYVLEQPIVDPSFIRYIELDMIREKLKHMYAPKKLPEKKSPSLHRRNSTYSFSCTELPRE